MNQKRIFIGVDPGTRVTGFGIIQVSDRLEVMDYGCIRPPASKRLTTRYQILFEAFCELLEKYRTDALAVEGQYVSRNVQSSLKLGMARGVITLAASLQQIPVFEYAPAKAKRAVVGNGRASKTQVQQMCAKLLRLNALPTPEDASDALALAICHAHSTTKGWHHKYQI
ncbi:MAG: crossover junction endodeoxyribonuclease RuvC [Chlamydiia bacterium]|nr:crossover junction endodeoxyribonuclease RuvC [Chlamydiia bacterium]